MAIPKGEFARRLCLADHFVASVPCGRHVGEATRLYGLLGEAGRPALIVIADAVAEDGRPIVERRSIAAEPHA